MEVLNELVKENDVADKLNELLSMLDEVTKKYREEKEGR